MYYYLFKKLYHIFFPKEEKEDSHRHIRRITISDMLELRFAQDSKEEYTRAQLRCEQEVIRVAKIKAHIFSMVDGILQNQVEIAYSAKTLQQNGAANINAPTLVVTAADRIRNVMLYLDQAMKGNLTTQRNILKQQVATLKRAATFAEARALMQSITRIKDKIDMNMSQYPGGPNVCHDTYYQEQMQEKTRHVGLTLLSVTLTTTMETTWEAIVPLLKNIIDVQVPMEAQEEQDTVGNQTAIMERIAMNAVKRHLGDDGRGSNTNKVPQTCFSWKGNGKCGYTGCRFQHEESQKGVGLTEEDKQKRAEAIKNRYPAKRQK